MAGVEHHGWAAVGGRVRIRRMARRAGREG